MPERRGTIFISYTHQDADTARAITSALDAVGLNPWLDECQINPGDSFLKRMGEGLTAADYVLVLFSKASLGSHWVEREWMSSLARNVVLVPVRLEPIELPALIRDLVWVDLFPDRAQGIKKLQSFFVRELEVAVGGGRERRLLLAATDQVRGKPLWQRSRQELRLVTMGCMKETEFEAYLYDMDIDRGEIQGQSFNLRILWLLTYLKDGGLSEGFAKWLQRERKVCVERTLTELDAETGDSPGTSG